ncbi:uncharacterized protein BDZ99DRAFT_480195 [Mytilinidion resinicola]|uniref:Zn(2)-C6 fungal-type domain-containing protein n=1 Tax=Mytilinidion resinicola TaxID=574789 RepID=A0A6A6YBJ0_9PEZI|nr:uncharacterized protein BDZ99DRAFT_480195 [Mytilinidion resinicola]KAF2805475.1 hypothetical protein BDZ99DRAFT_480195 [Mytilinidion resinicola]
MDTLNSSTSPSGSSDASPQNHGPSQSAITAGNNRNNLPRKSHTKSRRGCRRCKQRKIKCDEVHPECGNCVKHSVPCDFKTSGAVTVPVPASKRAISRLTVSKSDAAPSSSSTSPIQPSLHLLDPTTCATRSQIPDWSHLDRMLELRIFHHYTSTAYGRHYRIPIAQELWTVLIPTLAFEQPCLMDSVLACSALHMRIQTPQDSALTQASHRYMARSIRTYLEALRGGITKQNFDTLYLTAMFIAFHTFLNRRFEPQNATTDNMAVEWFQPFQGAKVIVEAALAHVSSSAVTQIFPGMRVPLFRCDHLSSECNFGFLLNGLARDEPDYKIYRYATSHMCRALHCRQPRFFIRFLSDAPSRISELLRLGDPRSMVIAFSFFSLMKSVPIRLWWLDGAADGEIARIRMALPEAWLPMLEQAHEVVWGCTEMCDNRGLHAHGPDNQSVPMVSMWQQDWTHSAPKTLMTNITEQELLWART